MKRTEAQTRQEIINKRLKQSGWDVKDPSQVTEELDIWVGDGMPQPAATDSTRESPSVDNPYHGHKFADYGLLGKDGHPLAVVEAKKTSKDPRIGKEQSRDYAENIKKNSGKEMPFVFYTNGYDIYFWDTERYPPRKVYGFPTRDQLERMAFLRSNSTPLSEEMVNKDISGRPYQIQAIRSVLEDMQKKQRKFLLVMATGTGKTRTCISLIDVLMRANWIQRVLFLVDRIALRDQALEAFEEYLPNAPRWPEKGEYEITTDRRVYVSTYPTMLNIIEQDEMVLSPHFFDLIVADESHRSIYNVYKNIFDYFDAMQLGLTATPKDQLDHNTFKLFSCEDGLPTFAYSYKEAVENTPPFLSDFEVLNIKTKFQKEGINNKTIMESEQLMLIDEGKDPEDINFEGTDLEVKVTNKGTNALIVQEFMEECIKDPNGVTPGKTIIFAMTQKHAHRLCEIFDALYPEYKGKIAAVLTSNVKGVHGKGGLLDRFKNKDMPRIAISVDMLDTGIDVREIVNLVFAKPVYTYSKFWQMIGRGTRVLEPTKIQPWCPEKDKFLIMDCWNVFEYFKENAKGKTDSPTIPVPVRRFNARLNKLQAAMGDGNTDIIDKVKTNLRKDLSELPKNSVIVLENKTLLAKLEDEQYWNTITDIKQEELKTNVAPIMRALSGVDYKAMYFEIDIIQLGTAHLNKDIEQFETIKEGVVEKISQLPLSVNTVAKERDLIGNAQTPAFWRKFSEDGLEELVEKLGPLMRFRDDGTEIDQEKLDLKDLLTVKDYIEFGPEMERITTSKYREKVEQFIQGLLFSNPVLQKLKSGQELTEDEIKGLARILREQDPYVTEESLQKVYDNRKAKFIHFIKHILGLEELTTFTETVSKAFDEFIAQHTTYSQQQLLFISTLKTFILQTGGVQKKDLINDPFTNLHPDGVRGVFNDSEIQEILQLTQEIT